MGVSPIDPAIQTVIDELKARVERLETEIAELKTENDELRRRLSKYENKPDPDPSTPSGMKPPYQKPNKRNGRKKKPGRKKGHTGARRKKPSCIDNHERHPLGSCPHCGSTEFKQRKTRKRYTEDLPKVEPIVTEHSIEAGRCKGCGKWVSATVADAPPRCTFGFRLVLITAWMHYWMGAPVHKVVTWLRSICQLAVSAGGLCQAWARVAASLTPLYDEIWEEIRRAGVLHVDETSWRVNGTTYWLWCFATKRAVLYVIDPTRGSPVLLRILGEVFDGVLVTDFYAAYNRIAAWAKQRCVVHLLRELEKVSVSNATLEWLAFQRKLSRLLRDALRLGRDRERHDDATYERRWKRLYSRLFAVITSEYSDDDANRIAKRLERHQHELFTFLEHEGVASDNNHGEREIRPAVQMRKAYGGNRSERGAQTQAELMSIFRTLEKRDVDAVDYLMHALRGRLQTGVTPSLPIEELADAA